LIYDQKTIRFRKKLFQWLCSSKTTLELREPVPLKQTFIKGEVS